MNPVPTFTSSSYRSLHRMGIGKAPRVDALARVGKFAVMRKLTGPNPFADAASLGDSQVVVILKIEPKLRRQTKVLSQANGGVCADGAVSPDNFIDPRKAEGLRQFIGAHTHGLHEFGLENVSRVNCKYLP